MVRLILVYSNMWEDMRGHKYTQCVDLMRFYVLLAIGMNSNSIPCGGTIKINDLAGFSSPLGSIVTQKGFT